MRVYVKSADIIPSKIAAEVVDDRARLFCNQQFYKLISDFTPRYNGTLMTNVNITSQYVHYKSPYAHYMYTGKLYVDPITGKGCFYNPDTGEMWSRPNVKKVNSGKPLKYNKDRNPYASAQWDKVAMLSRKQQLIKTMQEYFRRGL